MSGAYPWDTCQHGQVHSGRAQGMSGLVLDGALRTCTIFIDVLGQILSHGVKPMPGDVLVGLGAQVSAGEVGMLPLWLQSER